MSKYTKYSTIAKHSVRKSVFAVQFLLYQKNEAGLWLVSNIIEFDVSEYGLTGSQYSESEVLDWLYTRHPDNPKGSEIVRKDDDRIEGHYLGLSWGSLVTKESFKNVRFSN